MNKIVKWISLTVAAIIVSGIVALSFTNWLLQKDFMATRETQNEIAGHRQETREAEHVLKIARLQHAAALVGEKWRLFKTSVLIILIGGGMTAFMYFYRSTSVLNVVAGRITIPVHRKLITGAAWLQINREVIKSEQMYNHFPEIALEKTEELAKTMAAAIRGARGNITTNTNIEQGALLEAAPVRVPTFNELLATGSIAPGKPLIIGYTGESLPKTAELDDNYSTVVIGQSGTGKTSGEAYSIASTMLSYGARYTILDPHYPDAKKESLGDRLGVLADLPHVTIHNNPMLLDEIVSGLDQEFEAYKASGVGHVPHIIVVDEHSLWKNSSSGGKDLLKFEEKIIYEGRKFGWYLHVTSKSPLAQDFGSSAVRDNFVTSLMYKVRKKQAQTYFQDANTVEMVQKCDKPGMAVYTDRQDVSEVLQVPLATESDMKIVYQKVSNGGPVPVTISTGNDTETTPETPQVTGGNADIDTMPVSEILEAVRGKLAAETVTLSGLAKEIGCNKGLLHNVVKRDKNMPESLQHSLSNYLHPDQTNVIEASDRFQTT